MDLRHVRFAIPLGRTVLALLLLLAGAADAGAQGRGSGTITGTVSVQRDGSTIAGARVIAGGTALAATTRGDGRYRLIVPAGSHELLVSSIGFAPQRQRVTVSAGGTATQDFTLTARAVEVDEIAVIGSRRAERTVTDAPVPVDVLSAEEIRQTGRTETSQIIQALAPSFNFPRATVSDGTDHSRPATLRGLAPDQVLVLVNGKRRHMSALINVNNSVGRGAGMVDLNAIPASSIERIEILRDGAAAQYGSDAIAGVINIILKRNAANEFSTMAGITKEGDGEVLQAAANYALRLGEAGTLQLSGEVRDRGYTNRSEPDFRQQYFPADNPLNSDPTRIGVVNHRQGDAAVTDGGLFFNLLTPIAANTELYFFGGGTIRSGEAAGFWRRALDDRTVRSIFPDGFLPLIATDINDLSGAVGLQGAMAGWRWDLSTVFGRNQFQFDVNNSANASLGSASPTEFYAGTLKFDQLTTNLDLVRGFDIGLGDPISFAVGGEFRRDGYGIEAGDPASYVDGGVPIEDGPAAGGIAAPGAQVFPGFQPGDEVDESRRSVAGYVDIEVSPVRNVLFGAAGRVEHYNDFGSTTNGKLTARIEPVRGIALRGAVSSGFRAPSLGQSFFSSTATNFINGLPFELRTFPVTSPVAQAIGALPLEPEKSLNLSAGAAFFPLPNLSVTVDFYRITIDDRIVLSGNFTGGAVRDTLAARGFVGVAGGRYFTNAIDTRTRGVDVIANYGFDLGRSGLLRLTGGLNINRNAVTSVKPTPSQLQGVGETLFDRVERARIEVGQPRNNINFSSLYTLDRLTVNARTQRFGQVTLFGTSTDGSLDQVFGAKWITDLSLAYRILETLNLAVGADNIFDVYPDPNSLGQSVFPDPANCGPNGTTACTQAGNSNFGIFPYNQISPFGFNGAFYYARLTLGF